MEPDRTHPYWISDCFAKSSAVSIGGRSRSRVRKDARLAVYEEMMTNEKNHQTTTITRADADLLRTQTENHEHEVILYGLREGLGLCQLLTGL